MKKTLTKILTLIIAVIMSMTFIGCAKNANMSINGKGTGNDVFNNTGLTSEKTKESIENQTFTELNEPAVMLAMSPYAMNRATNTVSRTLTATVLPVDAPDKSVDWTIEWCVPVFEGADISDYLTVTPEFDGALSATVTAFQGFEGGTAYVTCTTRVGGFSAQCLITYDGAPESLVFVLDGTDYSTSSMLELTVGESYDIELALRNTLGAVGSKYGNYVLKQIDMQGRFVAEKIEIINGTVTSREEVTIDLGTGKAGDLTIPTTEFMTVALNDNILTVNVLKSEGSFIYPNTPTQNIRTGTQYLYKAPYYDPQSGVADNCRLSVLVEDTVSGKQSILYIDIQSTVDSISLNESTFAF